MKVTQDKADKPVKIVMSKPSDMHQHLRQGAMLRLVTPMVAKRFASAIIMPNTTPAITSFEMVIRYVCEIVKARDDCGIKDFRPLMTLYLTDTLEPKEVETGIENKVVFGVKYYPRGLTTNSDSGVRNPADLWTKGTRPYECLRVLAESGRVLLLHAADGLDDKGNELDPYEQEKHFIRETLPRIADAHPDLKISIEHLSTKEGVEFVIENGGRRLGCSLTMHHLTRDRRDVFRGGFHPHLMWWPIIQPSEHKEALRELAILDKPFVWLGSDSAPHPVGKKECACCVGGVLTAHIGIEGYLEAFEDMGALDDRFERFASINGPQFFGIEPSNQYLTLVREEWKVEKPFISISTATGIQVPFEEVIPFRLGETVRWKLVN